MSAYVKTIDSRHLVASGLANVSSRISDIGIPTIDFGVWHGYPKYYNLTVDAFDRLIGEFCDIGATHNKPVLLEEFGYARSNHDQVSAYRKWMTTIKGNPNSAGWLLWRLVSVQDSGRFPVDTFIFAQQHDKACTSEHIGHALPVVRRNASDSDPLFETKGVH
jgi:mannan endo-1,4-beta-mannosidase